MNESKNHQHKTKPGRITLFGSGEMSPTGRKIHEDILKSAHLSIPVKIGILETPTGFEVNALHSWPERMQEFFERGLINFQPEITRIRAWKKSGNYSTNDPQIVDAITEQDYLYAGAGSPSYTVNNLRETRAWKKIIAAHQNGTILCLGSATAVASGKYALPVYEIFKVGHDIHWIDGLDLFSQYDLNLTIVPHWNNREGADFDTSRCWMGTERFKMLQELLPKKSVILGIDEQTVAVFDFVRNEVEVMGVGTATVIKKDKEIVYQSGTRLTIKELR